MYREYRVAIRDVKARTIRKPYVKEIVEWQKKLSTKGANEKIHA